MRKFFLALIIFVLAVWAGLKIAQDPGYALFAYKHWTMEMPLWFAMVALLFFVIVIYWALRFFSLLGHCSDQLHNWSERRKRNKTHRFMCRGLMELIEGHWKQAEKHLIRNVALSETPLINYLMAAKAAHAQGAFDRRDNYLRLAHQDSPDAKIAIGLTQAELQLDQKQLEQGLATLQHLRSISPHHHYILKELYHLYVELNDWKNLLKLLPELKKHHILSESDYFQTETEVYCGLLTRKFGRNSTESLIEKFHAFPKNMRRHPVVVKTYALYLLQLNDHVTAEQVVRDTLDHHWDEGLMQVYKMIHIDNAKQLKVVMHWKKHHPQSAALYAVLGELNKRLEYWGQAREALETSLSLDPAPETYFELALLLEQLSDGDNSQKFYKKGLALFIEQKNDHCFS